MLMSSCGSKTDKSQFYHPSEFESTHSTCFIWSTNYYEIIPKLVGIVSKKDRVTLFIGEGVNDKAAILRSIKSRGGNPDNIQFVNLNKKLDNIWFRDYGPTYLINGMGQGKLVEFNYFWSNYDFIEDFASL
jgi:agmatine/peptidylarginine deiminase